MFIQLTRHVPNGVDPLVLVAGIVSMHSESANGQSYTVVTMGNGSNYKVRDTTFDIMWMLDEPNSKHHGPLRKRFEFSEHKGTVKIDGMTFTDRAVDFFTQTSPPGMCYRFTRDNRLNSMIVDEREIKDA